MYVSGLPKAMTQQELEQLFTPYGRIITSRILCDNMTGKLQAINESILLARKHLKLHEKRLDVNPSSREIPIMNWQPDLSRFRDRPSIQACISRQRARIAN